MKDLSEARNTQIPCKVLLAIVSLSEDLSLASRTWLNKVFLTHLDNSANVGNIHTQVSSLYRYMQWVVPQLAQTHTKMHGSHTWVPLCIDFDTWTLNLKKEDVPVACTKGFLSNMMLTSHYKTNKHTDIHMHMHVHKSHELVLLLLESLLLSGNKWVCVYIDMHMKCMYVCNCICTHVCVCMCMYVCMHACMYVCMCVWVRMYVSQ
jgi:hypothetical protein